jgi:hypothetical protein
MRDLWLDREYAELDSQQYFEELALDDHLIELWEETQEKEIKLQAELEMMIEQEIELPF